MKVSEMKQLLRKNGCFLIRDGGNHEVWYSPATNRKFAVPRHNTQDVPTGTYRSIMKAAGLIGRGDVT